MLRSSHNSRHGLVWLYNSSVSCQIIARRYSSQAYFYKLDVSEYPSVINYFGINMLPCVLAIYYDYNEDGELVAYYDGYRGEPYLHTSNIDALVRRVVSNHITADR